MSWTIDLGGIVQRRALHQTYGGNLSALVSPSGTTPNVFVFVDQEQLGAASGVRWYGDHLVVPGGGRPKGIDRAVLNHRQDGRALRLFLGRAEAVAYLGEFAIDERDPVRSLKVESGSPAGDITQFVLRPVHALEASDPQWRAGVARVGAVFIDHSGLVHADPACDVLWGVDAAGSPRATKSVTRQSVGLAPVSGPLCDGCVGATTRFQLGRAPSTGEGGHSWDVRFRLDPPEGPRSWRLHLLAFSPDQPGAAVTAHDVRSGRADLICGDGTAAQIGAAVERASSLPSMANLQALELDEGVELTDEQLRAFLEQAVPELESKGYTVVRPSIRRPRPRFVVRSAVPASSTFDLAALLEFRWDVAVDDELLTAEELRALMEQKRPVVSLHGQWLELWPAEVSRDLANLARHVGAKAELSAEDLMGGDSLQGPGGIAVDVELPPTVWAWVVGASGRSLPVALPRFADRLRPYQRDGSRWLASREALGLGALLADEMGLGKTAQLLAVIAADHLERAEPPSSPTLVVAPLTVLRAWQDEIRRWCPALRFHQHQGGTRPHGAGFTEVIRRVHVVLTNYDTLRNDRGMFRQVPWRRLVLDEAQNIKNPSTDTRRAVKALSAEHRIAVTGTPIENRVRDLWSIMDVINPGLLGPLGEFDKVQGQAIDEGDEGATAELLEKVQPMMLRRLKSDPAHRLGLPEKLEAKTYCQLTPEQISLYQLALNERVESIAGTEGGQRRLLVGNLLVRLKQICDHPWLADKGARRSSPSGKLNRLDELLDETLVSGQKVLVFTQFVEMGHLLVDHITEKHSVGVRFLYGATSVDDRGDMVDGINQDEQQRVLVLQIKAGGSGLTLTGASTVVHYDRWWNPAVEDQATDRVHRIGQSRTVLAAKFICIGTFEERLDALIEQKRARGERLLGPIAELSRLQAPDLKDFLLYDGP